MSKKHNLVIKEEANLDITDAYEWYESKQPNLGTKFKRQLLKTFKSIQLNPNGSQIAFKNNRQATVSKFPYIVVFEVFDTTIVVFAVFHTCQDPKKKLR
jgi:plasmid stabilization system protein ParE